MLIHERDCRKTFFFSSVTAKIWLAILPSFLLTRRWFQQLNYLWVSAYEFCNIVSKNLTLFLYLFAVWIKLLDLQLSDSNFRRTVSESLLIQFMQNWKCLRGFIKSFQRLILSGFIRWSFMLTFSSTGKSWEKITGPRKSLEICLTQAVEFSEFALWEM